jgi:hypothetical protein
MPKTVERVGYIHTYKHTYIHTQAEEYTAMPKTVERVGYTRRITEIIRNVDKQKRDIDRILDDTRSIQKDINS